MCGACSPTDSSADLTSSPEISFNSSAPRIATVDRRGGVSPVASGSVKVTVMFRGSSADVPVTVSPKK